MPNEITQAPQTYNMTEPAPITVEQMMLTALNENKVDALEKLMAMRDRDRAQAAEQAFIRAMVDVQSKIEPVARKAYNEQTRSYYAKYEQIYRAVMPMARAAGLAFTFGTADSPLPAHVRVVADLMHRDGHSKRYQTDLATDEKGIKGNPSKTLLHGEGSAMTYGMRYLTLMAFNVLLVPDNDGNGAKDAGETITPEQAATLHTMLVDSGSDIGKFLRRYGIERVEDLPAREFASVVKIIQQKQAAAS